MAVKLDLLNAQLKDSSGSKKTIPSSGSSTGKKSIEQALAEKLAKSGKTASATAKTTTKTTREAYYSPPEFGREEELQGLASAVENAGKKYQIGRSLAESTAERVVQLQQELESKRVHTSTRAGRAVYAGIEREYQHYAKLNGMAVTKAQECFDAYQRAVDSYNGYAQKQQAEYERWKSTIRDEDTIRAELDEVAKLVQTAEGIRVHNQQWLDMLPGILTESNRALIQGYIESGLSRLEELGDVEGRLALLEEELGWSQYYRYADLMLEADFAEKSKYASTANGQETLYTPLSGVYAQNGYNDITYDYINKNLDAQRKVDQSGIDSGKTLLGMDDGYLKQMTEEEVGIFNYLYATQGAEAAYEYTDYLKSDLNRRQRQTQETWMAQAAQDAPVAASVYSVLTSPMKGVGYIGQAVDLLGDGKIDENAAYNKYSYTNSAIRNQIAQQIEQSGKWGPAGSFLYQTGMSMGDFVINSLASGGSKTLALAIMGTGAAADTTLAAKDRGVEDSKAFLLGTVAGLAEIVTEKVSIETLLDKTSLGKNAMGYWLKNVLAEGGEEVSSSLINLTADALVAKDKSEWALAMAEYQEQGMNETDAFLKVLGEQLVSLGLDALGGGISGGVFAGVEVARNGFKSPEAGIQAGKSAPEVQEQEKQETMPGQVTQALPLTAEPITQTQVGEQKVGVQGSGGEPSLKVAALNTMNPLVTGYYQTADQKWKSERMEKASTNAEVTGIMLDVAEERIQQALRIGKAVGKEIFFYAEDPTEFGIQHGVYGTGTDSIGINVKSGNVMAATIGHELTHSIEMAESYGKLQKLVLKRIQATGGDLKQLREEKQRIYENNGQKLTNQGANQEIVAQYVEEHLLTDEVSITSLVKEDVTLGHRILNWLDGLLAKLGNKDAQERAFVRRARKIYARALEEAHEAWGAQKAAEKEAQALEDAKRSAYEAGDDEAGDAVFDAQWETDGYVDRMLERDFDFGGGPKYSIAENVTDVNGLNHDRVVVLDYKVFDKVRRSGKAYIEFIRNNLIKQKITVFDDNGDSEVIEFAGENERVRKDGAKNSHPVIGELTQAKHALKKLVIVNAVETAKISRIAETSEENSHQWLDTYGWEERTSYVMTKDGEIYPVTLHIARSRDGRNILYDVNVKIKEGLATEKSATSQKTGQAFRSTKPSGKKITHNSENVNKYSIGENDERHTDDDSAEDGGFTKGWYTDDEAARAALLAGYPVINGVQVVPMKTIVLAQDIKRNREGREIVDKKSGEPVRNHNYGIVVGLGEKKGTLLVNFHNKEKVNEFTRETIRRDNVQIAYEDLTPTPGVFQRTEADFNSLMSQAPEQMNDYEYTDEELAEIEKLRNQAYMDDDSGERVAWEPVKPEELSGKALAHFGATRRELVSRVAQALRVPRQAQKEFLKPIADQIAAEYLCNGTVSREIRDRLFDTAWEQGRVVDQEFYDRYKEVKDYLRTTGVTLSERYQGDIPDYNDFRKRSFGSVKIVNDGLPADVAWMELQEMAPELFPEDIANPADQLQHMANVAGSIRKVEKTLDEHYGSDAAEMKQSSRDDFDDAVRYAIGRLRQVKQVADERRVERDVIASEKGEKSETDIAALYPRLKDARRAVEKAVAKNLLTKDGDLQVRRLLCHDIRPEDLNPARDDLKGILAVYEAKAKYEEIARQIRNWNRAKKAKLAQEAEEHLREAGRIADKKVGFLYSRETMERNIRDIVEDPEAAERIIRTYFKPVHDGAAAATRLKDDYRQRVKELGISRKVKKGDQVSEAYAVQLYGESQDIIEMMEKSRGRIKTRDGKTLAEWKETQRQLWEQNRGIDKEKVQSAVAEFRKIYDELFTRMNEVRIRNGYEPVNYRHGYFPHFQQEGRDGVMGLFGRALGIDTAVTALPTTINGMTHTFKPGIRWFGNAMERQGFETAYDAIEGFDRYIEGIADVICQTDNIQRLRALANQMRYRTSDKGLQEQIDKIRERDDLTEPEREAIIKDKFENGKFELSNFVVELEEYTNLLANKKSRADRNMEQAMGRKAYNVVKAVESRVAANMVAINPASWLTNFVPLTQGWACLGSADLQKGIAGALKAVKADDGMVDMSSFLTNRRGSDPLIRTWTQSASAALTKPMELIDQFVAESLVRARYWQNVKRGLSETEAVSEADDWTAGVMADRSKGATPTLFNRSNPLTKIFTQFQLEVNNQFSYLFKDMPRDQKDKGKAALAAALMKFFLGAWLYNEVYEYFIGRRPALDPIGILNDTVGDAFGVELPNLVELGTGLVTGDMPSFQTEKAGVYGTAANLFGNVAQEMPFIGGVLDGGRVPISSALPNWENLGKAALSEDWSTKKRLATAAKELGTTAAYTLLPFGGTQLKRIWEGLQMAKQKGSYTVDKDGNQLLQYPLPSGNEWALALQAAVFGKTSLSTGREWIENGFGTLSADQTEAYQAIVDLGADTEEAYDLLVEIRSAERSDTQTKGELQREILRASGLSDECIGIVYYDVLASENEVSVMDELLAMDADMGAAARVLMDIKDAESSNDKRSAILMSGLSEDAKIEIYRYAISDERDEDIKAFRDSGLSFDDFLTAQNAHASIKEQYEDEGDMATAFARWVNQQGYTANQKTVIREKLKYWQMVPANSNQYDKGIAAGLTDEQAYELAENLGDLKPEDGKTQVSNVQKWREAVDLAWNTDSQIRTLKAVMDDNTYRKVEYMWDYGVAPAAYVRAQEVKSQYDADGNGNLTNKEWQAVVDAISSDSVLLPGGDNTIFYMDTAQKAILWQMLTGAESSRNNPYSSEWGEKVIQAEAEWKAARG